MARVKKKLTLYTNRVLRVEVIFSLEKAKYAWDIATTYA
jgi:hypothetical protein